jgi:hypothetical protein
MTLKLVLGAAMLFFAGVTVYQGRVIANQQRTIQLLEINPCQILNSTQNTGGPNG